MAQKAIDGQENPLTVINANKFYQVQKQVALTKHQYNPQTVIVSNKRWGMHQRYRQEAAGRCGDRVRAGRAGQTAREAQTRDRLAGS